MQSQDQDAIQETVASFLGKELPLDRVRKAFDEGLDIGLGETWRRAGELGFFGLGLSEERGGSGFALSEEMTLFTELGRFLSPGPWLGSVLAAHALNNADTRSAVLSGELPCAFVDCSAADGVVIEDGHASGELPPVADGSEARALLMYSGGGWYFAAGSQDGWDAQALRSFDPTRRLSRIVLAEQPCVELLSGAEAARLHRVGTILTCAEAVGGIERTVEMSVDYCKVRTQFDKPIGSFQAVKHRCADMAVRAEVARSATIYATICVRDDREDADLQVSVAKLLCGDAYLRNTADNIQNHGGMGFTWECDAHLYLKRAHGFDLGFGSGKRHIDDLVARMRAA